MTSVRLITRSFLILALVQGGISFGQNIGINSTGATPNASALLDVSATDKGLLLPRVALTAKNSASPITSPATSLLVYNTATAGTTPNQVAPGYYFWSGTEWIAFLSTSLTNGAWGLNGNSGTSATSNYIGTSDATDFIIRTNAIENVRVSSAGEVGVGTITPQAKLDVNGTIKLGAIGTTFNSLLRTNITISNSTNITQSTPVSINVTMTGVTTNASVILTPRAALSAGVAIGSVRASATNTITIVFINTGSTTRTLGTNVVFDVTVIQ